MSVKATPKFENRVKYRCGYGLNPVNWNGPNTVYATFRLTIEIRSALSEYCLVCILL